MQSQQRLSSTPRSIDIAMQAAAPRITYRAVTPEGVIAAMRALWEAQLRYVAAPNVDDWHKAESHDSGRAI